MPNATQEKAPLPPQWFIRLAWRTHRRLYRWTGGRLGLWRPKPNGWGAMRLTTIGRRTGQTRPVIVGYFEDGPNLVTMAMNGWGDAEPAWWLNLQAHPDALVDLVDGTRPVTAWAAQGDERERLWARWRQIDKNLDAYAARRTMQTAVVVLEPRLQSAEGPIAEASERRGRFSDLVDNARGAGEMVFHLGARWRRTERTAWGASADEAVADLPGDVLVPDPSWRYTHSIIIDAAPSVVWQWVVQLGQGRGGFYSFEYLENLAGCRIHNTVVVLTEFQHLAVGDPIWLHPKAPPLVVRLVEPERCLVLVGADADGEPVSMWAFHLRSADERTTRLIERGVYRVGPNLSQRLMLGPAILEPVSFVMSRQMLRTIKGLAERHSSAH